MPSQSRIDQLRGRDLIHRMNDEIREHDDHPALRSCLSYALHTGRPAAEYENIRQLWRDRRAQLERRIEHVRRIARLEEP